MNPVLQQLADQVTASTQVEASAVLLIKGFAQRLTDAIAAAVANGATAAELQPVQAEVDALKQSATDLASAVAANTPVAGTAPTSKKKP